MANAPPAYDQIKTRLKTSLAAWVEREHLQGGQGLLDRQMIAAQLADVLKAFPPNGRAEGPLTIPEQEQLIDDVAEEVVRLGPLQPLLEDPTISEIMVNGPNQIVIERNGRLEPVAAVFKSKDQLMSAIERLLDIAGVSVTEMEPCVDASLDDGTRINVIIPPLVLNGPTVTIRKKSRHWRMDDFLSVQTLSHDAAQFLEACVKARVNMIVSGGTSTAKTTLVSVLSAFMPPDERVITIENVAELELFERTHWIRLVGRSSNIEGKGEIPLRTLVRNALRMRPDRIILGEARAGEALDVVMAMHTGHDGVITVLHANSPRAALERLETLMLMSGLDLPPQICRTQIASAVDLVVHLVRFADGTRRVATITQVVGASGDSFDLQDVFVFDATGFSPEGVLQGSLRYTGVRPRCVEKFQLHNVEVPAWVKERA